MDAKRKSYLEERVFLLSEKRKFFQNSILQRMEFTTKQMEKLIEQQRRILKELEEEKC